MEPEVQNLETSEFSGDQSENHSSTSDIIHLEAYPCSRVDSDEEEDVDLQSSTMSMLDSEKELAEMRAEIGAEPDLRPPEAVEILMCVEDPIAEESDPEDTSEPIFTHTPLLSEPSNFTLASIPIPEIISQVLEHLPSPQEFPQTSPSTLMPSEEAHYFNSKSSNARQEHTASSLKRADTSGSPNSSFFEIPVLLVGGAALMAVVGVLTYTLNRK